MQITRQKRKWQGYHSVISGYDSVILGGKWLNPVAFRYCSVPPGRGIEFITELTDSCLGLKNSYCYYIKFFILGHITLEISTIGLTNILAFMMSCTEEQP